MPLPSQNRKGSHDSVARRGGMLFLVRIPLALAMEGISHKWSRGAKHLLCAYHTNQVCGLAP